MRKQNLDQSGFTVIEIISVMVILGVVTSVVVAKSGDFSEAARQTLLTRSIRELNTREMISWSRKKLSNIGYTTDVDIFNAIDTNLGTDFKWAAGPDVSGGTLRYQNTSINLTRTASTVSSIALWK